MPENLPLSNFWKTVSILSGIKGAKELIFWK